jgi:transcriptional regulator with XRE-family HTH domain
MLKFYRISELMSRKNTEKMNNFENITEKLKESLNISTNKELADRLNIKNSTFSERKRTNSIPYKEIIELCNSENLDLNYIINNAISKKKEIDYKKEIIETLEKLSENDIKSIYHFTKSKEN